VITYPLSVMQIVGVLGLQSNLLSPSDERRSGLGARGSTLAADAMFEESGDIPDLLENKLRDGERPYRNTYRHGYSRLTGFWRKSREQPMTNGVDNNRAQSH